MRRLLLALVVACDVRVPHESPELTLARMIDEPRVGAYEPSAAFPDGSGMQRPPEGTVPADADLAARGAVGDAAAIPRAVDAGLLARGRARYDIVCATCHGLDGEARTVVAEKMTVRPPPSLHEPRIAALPPGRTYAIVRDGYGLMPPLGALLPSDDRWAVVAYLEALRLSRAARVSELSPSDRAALDRELR